MAQRGPLVSVVIAARDAAPYIGAALASLRGQTLPAWEVWVVDDGSRDATASIVAAAAAADARIHLLRTPGGLGPYGAANLAWPHCRAPFLARLDADDLCRPDRFATQVAYFARHPGVALLGSGCRSLPLAGPGVTVRPDPDPAVLCWQLLWRNRLVHSTLMVRRAWFLASGGYPPGRLAQDYAVWCRGARAGVLGVVPEALVAWRIHPASLSSTDAAAQRAAAIRVAQAHARAVLGVTPPAAALEAIRLGYRGRPAAAAGDVRRGVVLLGWAVRRYLTGRILAPDAARRVRADARALQAALLLANRHAHPATVAALLPPLLARDPALLAALGAATRGSRGAR